MSSVAGAVWSGPFLLRSVVAAVVLLCGVVPLSAEEGQVTNDQFTVRLVDGSSIVCRPAAKVLPVKTSFGSIQLPLDRVESMKFDQAAKTVTVSLLNGDRLQGKLELEAMTVSSALGDLKISFDLVREVATLLKREPVYEDTPERRNYCVNNLRKIDAAKEQAALEYRLITGAPVAETDARVNAYIKGNATPVCPAGGKYTYGPIGSNPACSVPGHSLPGP